MVSMPAHGTQHLSGNVRLAVVFRTLVLHLLSAGENRIKTLLWYVNDPKGISL